MARRRSPWSCSRFGVEDGRVVARHRSEPFRVSSARPFYPDEGRILESTVFTERPKDWQERQAIYVIAVPANMRRQGTGVSAHPSVLFAKSVPFGIP